MRSRVWLVAGLLFWSGFCALVYQVGWLRDFRLIFGSSTAASAAVLAIFIGGLGFGGLLLGPRADRHPRPLLFYSQLESIVAVSAAATPLLLTLVRAIYIASGGSTRLGTPLATIARLILSVLVLAIPTIAMGGTLPAAARAVTRDADVRRQDVAALYAFNTLGAVFGCLVATFSLLELFGTRSTLWLAAALNLLVAVIARQADRSLAPVDAASPAIPETGPRHATHRQEAVAPVPFVLVASGVVGFAFFLMEMVWYRLLAPLLGGSVFTFGLVLAIALGGIGIGGLLYALVSVDTPATLSGFAMSCVIEAAAVAATFALGDRIALLALAMLPLHAAGFTTTVATWTIVTSIVVLPPALIAEYQFPLLIALFGHGREKLGRQIGATYAANTAGAIVGSLAGGFGLLPWLSAPGAWRLVAVVLLTLGLAAIAMAAVQSKRFRGMMLVQVGLAAITVVLIAATGPTAVWRHSGIGAGRAPVSEVFATPNALRGWANRNQQAIVWDADGTESGIALQIERTGYAFIVNGKSDGAAISDAGTQIMLGMIAATIPQNPRHALIIGLGTGSSAGWLAAIPQMERVDVVELEPLVVRVADACRPVNHDALDNPKMHVTIGDAREVLLTIPARYDVIASEPSNPYRAGVASLFTAEYYRAANDRLNDDGVFAQWVQAYEIDASTLQTIYATMAAVFPQVETWRTARSDLVLIGSKRAHTLDLGALASRISEEPFRTAASVAWRATDVNGFLAHYLASDALARTLASAPTADINTDDRNIVEFDLARSVGRTSADIIDDLRRSAQALHADRPAVTNGVLQAPSIDTAAVAFDATVGAIAVAARPAPAEEQARRGALVRYYAGDLAGARALWSGQTEGPRDQAELLMAADLEARTGSDAALPLIDRLRSTQPGEADVVLARLRLRQARITEAAAALESACVRFRSDPWPLTQIKEQALDLAADVVARDPSLAGRMFRALREPFAVRSIDAERLGVAMQLVMGTSAQASCGDAAHALEPHVPWLRDFLMKRRDCYQSTGDPLVTVAISDLREFLSHDAQPFGALVPRLR